MQRHYYVWYRDVTGYEVYQRNEEGDSKPIVTYTDAEVAANIARVLTNYAEYEDV